VSERTYASETCPYCAARLDPLPKAKKRCPDCGQPIYVRSGPDGVRYLLQEADLPTMEALWDEERERRWIVEKAQRDIDMARVSSASLRSYRGAGLVFIEMLAEDCPVCAAYAGKRIAIAEAPPIPVPGCTGQLCTCDYMPVVEW
jgi:hypothetical protein